MEQTGTQEALREGGLVSSSYVLQVGGHRGISDGICRLPLIAQTEEDPPAGTVVSCFELPRSPKGASPLTGPRVEMTR